MKPPGFRYLICSCAFMLLLCTWPLPAVTDASTQSPRNTQGITESNNKGALPDLSANKSNNSARGVIHNTSTDGTVISTTTGSDGIINGTTGSTASSASNANSTTRSTPSSASSANSTTGSTPSSAPSTTYNTTTTSEGSSNSSSINNGNSTIKDNVTDSPQCPEMCSCPQYEAWASYLVPYLRQRLGPKANKHTDYVMKLFLLQEFVHNAEPIKSILGELFERVQSEGDAQRILSLWWTRFGITRCYLVETTFYLDAAAEAVLFPQVQFKQAQRNLLAKNQGTPTENKIVEDRLDNYQLYNITFVCKNGSKVVVTKEASLFSSWLAEMKNGTAKNGVRVSDAIDVRCSAETDPGVRVAEWDSSGCTPINYLPWALTLGMVLALAAVLGPLLYVYRLQAMVTIHDRFHIRPFTRTVHYNEEDFDHEVLVVHGTSDAGLDWVLNTLIPRAQDTHHRLCLPDRDFLLGSPLADTYASSVARAKATLCLLSQDVTDDEWWRYAFQLARAENARSPHRKFLLVLLDRVDVAKQPEEVREFVKTNTYLSVKDPMFWKKLFFYLPDPPRTAL
ncbi:hypothetical protein ACOMHN_013091 [Nucella lapillus]